jgi:hypothetical protein
MDTKLAGNYPRNITHEHTSFQKGWQMLKIQDWSIITKFLCIERIKNEWSDQVAGYTNKGGRFHPAHNLYGCLEPKYLQFEHSQDKVVVDSNNKKNPKNEWWLLLFGGAMAPRARVMTKHERCPSSWCVFQVGG